MPRRKNRIKTIALIVIVTFFFQNNIFLFSKSDDELGGQFGKAKNEYMKGQYLGSKFRLERVIGIINEQGPQRKDILGKCYLILGAIYEKENKPLLAKENYLRAKGLDIRVIPGVDLDSLDIYRQVVKGERPVTVETVDTLFDEARNEYNNGLYGNSKNKLEQVIGLINKEGFDKNDVLGKCYLLLGAIYEKLGNTLLAEENYRKAKEGYKIQTVKRVNLDTLDIYRKIVKGEIGIDELFRKALGEFNRGRYPESKSTLKEVIGRIKDRGLDRRALLGKCYLLLGAADEKLGKIKPAEKNYRIAKEDYDFKTVKGVDLDELTLYKLVVRGISEHEGPKKKKKKFPVLLVVVIAAVVVGAILLLGGGSDNGSSSNAQTPTFVTSVDSLTVPERGTATFTVRLSAQPSSDVSVSVARQSGDSDISVDSGSALTFTTSNWGQNQTVRIAAADDTDTSDGTATIRISASGIVSKDITVTEQDDDTDVEVLNFVTDINSVTVSEGRTAVFQVKLSAQPASDITASVSRVSGDTDIFVQTGSTLTFTSSNWSVYQTVTLRASDDSDTTDGQAIFRISASGVNDKDITAVEDDKDSEGCTISVSITSPSNNDTITGDSVEIRAEVSGDCTVDYVEFYIDTVLVDTVSSAPYTYTWDTTGNLEGLHVLEVRAYATTGETAVDQISVTLSRTSRVDLKKN